MMSMKLNTLFYDRGYSNMAENISEFSNEFALDFFFNENDDAKMPKELLGLFISTHKDELFIVINGTGQDINMLCGRWDEKIRTFMIFGSNQNELLSKLKYNVVQIVLCENEVIDRTQEGSLSISRKIILPFKYDDEGQVELDEEAVLELPFVMIEAGETTQQDEIVCKLKSLVPQDGSGFDFLKEYRKKIREVKGPDGKTVKSFANEFEQIREWLTRDENTSDKN